MQLKMSNQFNPKLTKKIVQDEDAFISNVFSVMSLTYEDYRNERNDFDEMSDAEIDQFKDKEETTEDPNTKKAKLFLKQGENEKRARNFEELHTKFEQLKGQKKLDYKQKREKQNLKNRIKKKTKREERLVQKKLARTEQKAPKVEKMETETEVPKSSKQKPIFNSEGNMVFSKFDFSEIGAKKKPPKSEKNPKKALDKLESIKQKVKDLEAAGDKEQADIIREKTAWKSVLAKASGEKVKDDPELLKRSIKREEQKKKHSAKKWETRKEGVQRALEERQQIRKENILKRKKDKKVNNLKKSAKRGRVIPGY